MTEKSSARRLELPNLRGRRAPSAGQTLTPAQKVLRAGGIVLLGIILGTLAKLVDGTFVGLIGSYLGFWIVIGTVIGVWSRSPRAAALHVGLFFAAMLLSYYVYSAWLFGFFPKSVFLAWGAIGMLTPVGGWLIWHARGEGWPAALMAALPVSILVLDGYSFFYTYSLTEAFDIIAALALLFGLAGNRRQRLRVVPLAAVLFTVFNYLDLLYRLPG